MLARVEVGDRVDDVELGVGTEVVEHLDRGLAAQRADLDDPTRADGVQNRGDGDIPQWEHGAVAPSELGGPGKVAARRRAAAGRRSVPGYPPARVGPRVADLV